jgi:hypothetical protein
MALTLADLKKRTTTDFAAVTAALTKKTDYSKEHEGFWKPTQDKAGNASATIRFLPTHPDDELMYVKFFSHSFQWGGKGGKYYIENCPTTIDRDECPVCKLNKEAYATLSKEDAKKKTQGRARKQNYVANILVVKDPAKPENEGKVFMFKFGVKIMDKINEKLHPTFEDDKPVNIFDPWNGADFRLHLAVVDKYPTYDKSSFSDVKPISKDDEEILRIVNEQTALNGLVTEDKFKSEADLKKRLDYVSGSSSVSTQSAEQTVRELADAIGGNTKAAPKEKAKSAPKVEFDDVPDLDSGGDDLEAFFKDIAGE